MSTVPAPQPRSPSTTREQLDELDALLQRMLELPVDPAGAAAEGTEEVGAPTALAEPPAVTDVTVAAPDPRPLPEAIPTDPEPPAVVRDLDVTPPAPALPAATATRLAGDTSPWLGPVVLVNRLFDRATGPLGGAGQWLRLSRGRAVLGWAGLLLLALALGLVLLTWSGWF